MRKLRMMLSVGLTFAAVCGCAIVADAQPEGYGEVPILRSASTDALWCAPVAGGYDREPEFRETKLDACRQAVNSLDVDYRRERLIFWSATGDCHMRARVKVFRSDAERRVRVVLNVSYGGCRASGRRAGWMVVEKPPSSYRVSVEEVGVDREAEEQDTSFAFPLPPPVLTREDMPVRTVDVADCLPLSGVSRWIISTAKHLERALEGRPNNCVERIAGLNVDLRKETLAGASFASGHCERPDGLKVSMTRETSTHPRQNAYVLSAVYDDPVTPCSAWRTFPVWVVMPKLPSGYSFEVHARAVSRADEPRVRAEKPVGWIEK